MAPSQKLVRLSNKKYCKSDMLNLFRTTAETMHEWSNVLNIGSIQITFYRTDQHQNSSGLFGVNTNLQENQN